MLNERLIFLTISEGGSVEYLLGLDTFDCILDLLRKDGKPPLCNGRKLNFVAAIGNSKFLLIGRRVSTCRIDCRLIQTGVKRCPQWLASRQAAERKSQIPA